MKSQGRKTRVSPARCVMQETLGPAVTSLLAECIG
jgi:hypothetical protein